MSEYMSSRRRDEGDGFFCRFTFGQFFALLILEVFTIFFVFYLGARYGREFLGLDREKGLAAIQETEGEAEERPKVLSTSDPEAAKMAGELIAKAQTPELKDRIRQMIDNAQRGDERTRMPEVVEQKPVQKETIEEPEEEAVPAEETKVSAEGEKEKEEEAEAAASDSSVIRVKSAENARYSVQIGSYPNMKEATSVIEKWKSKGYPVYMMIADIPDRGRWYRVRLGAFETRGDAANYLKELQSRENVEALVVLNEQ